jgi:hypothetical protein
MDEYKRTIATMFDKGCTRIKEGSIPEAWAVEVFRKNYKVLKENLKVFTQALELHTMLCDVTKTTNPALADLFDIRIADVLLEYLAIMDDATSV